VVKYGYCRGQEPFNYVRNIIKKYFDYETKINYSSAAQTPMAMRLEQIENIPFDGVEGMYNPMQGLISRSARRELFLSHKLFDDETQLIPRNAPKNPFDQPKKELFVRTEPAQDSARKLFKGKRPLFQVQQATTPGYGLQPSDNESKINNLKPRR